MIQSRMKSILRDLREDLLEDALIGVGGDTFYVFVEMPEVLRSKYSSLAKDICSDGGKPQTVDHITILSVPPQKITPRVAAEAVAKIAGVLARMDPVTASMNGWGFFDKTRHKGTPSTALVGLVDAPGLSELQVAIKRAVMQEIDTSQNHGFTPHATFAYMEQGSRTDKLPMLGDQFQIDTISVATTKIQKIKVG